MMIRTNKTFTHAARIIAAIILCWTGSCKKYLDIPPPDNRLVNNTVFNDPASITAASNGLYEYCFHEVDYVIGRLDGEISLAGDDTYTNISFLIPLFQNSFDLSSDPSLEGIWHNPYACIAQANSFIEGITATSSITEDQKKPYLAEGKLCRAYFYLILTNLFGDVPLILTTDIAGNSVMPRSPRAMVDSTILDDLLYSRSWLPEAQSSNYFNQNTASAMLTRIYAYQKNWPAAEQSADEVINSSKYQLVSDLTQVFDKGSPEAIFQTSSDGTSLTDSASVEMFNRYFGLITPSLLNNFEPGDQRLAKWTIIDGGILTVHKYGSSSNQQKPVIIRYADIILLRAEARAQQNKLTDAVNDINLIRERAGLTGLPGNLTKDQVLNAFMKERRNEFFDEWITRWFDLSRWGMIQDTMKTNKPTTWTEKAALFPLLESILALNPFLTQTPGY